MSDPLVVAARERIGGQVDADDPLAGRTTLKVGGRARVVVRAESIGDLQAVAALCEEFGVGWLVLGRGSNLLVADDGWDGVVVTLGRGFRGVEPGPADGPTRRVRVGAAEPMPVLAVALERLGLGGMAFAVAIPGSVGGAVRMNAGAHGSEMVDVLRRVEVVRLAADGRVESLPAEALRMRYRHTALPEDAVVTAVEVELVPTDADTLSADMAEMRRWRRAHQPINEPSCGSTFRNPPGDSAGRLIDTAGLKGLRVGGARISETHANFITVEPGATAADVHAVIRAAQREVHRIHGIVLHPEVVLAGRFDEEER